MSVHHEVFWNNPIPHSSVKADLKFSILLLCYMIIFPVIGRGHSCKLHCSGIFIVYLIH